jgi:UDP-N-acetylmuramoyl-L-alanyl-D-glutamate--2,6-diaminopimelate ligase
VDRRQAIEEAIQKATCEDVVLIAGKGHEAYQLIGDKKLLFSDRDVVNRYVYKLKKRE